MWTSSLGWPRYAKVLTVMAVDAVISVVATWCAFSLRLDTPYEPTQLAWGVFAMALAIQVAAFMQFRLYRVVFRYVDLQSLLSMAKATALHGAILFGVLLVLRLPEIPRSLGLIQPVIVLVLVAASRALAGALLRDEALHELIDPGHRARVLIYGAGRAGIEAAAAIAHSRKFRLVAFVDDDPHKTGRTIHGHRVIAADEVDEIVELQKVTDILLALPGITRAQRNEIIESLRRLPVHVRTVPAMTDLASGRVSVQDIQELDLEDLLGRDAVAPDPELLAMNLTGKVVLVTGAGGSIGGELCRQITGQRPRRLLLVEHNEFGLYAIHNELMALCSRQGLEVDLVPLLCSVRNFRRLGDIFRAYRPQTVYHAAAYKHVPMVEHNAAEGVDNNVFGTLKVAASAIACGVERFVLISTDKAVRPTNVMGASKRVAELILQALAAQQAVDFTGLLPVHAQNLPRRTCFAMVRFGNVLDSSGSVVPLFRKQLALGGPLTVTHREVTRYFMTIPEAAQLVLQAGAMAVGGDVFVLDMGTPVRIFDLAQRMIALSGLSLRDADHPFGDIEIEITGLRPGEKLYEELLIGDNPLQTSHPRIMKAREELVEWPELVRQLQAMRAAVECNDVAAIKSALSVLVSGYAGGNEIVDHLGPVSIPPEPAPAQA
ncbi:polysaccharide biosynthesis protein [Ramlibacter pallidus]|uniref:Polysaccharide biosynthesis protein n=1 Tax=Ramlibacter pallidus TaxID=2780087 RepID=A0ABR9RYF4_9BURK|nr:nucleoside-diphosphate sugar epimerase/dehydratase [Ramlibacter pallidus]MBE7366258.1 polysaccharide biosynthesis protein [Ramlibacter pallidus]